MEYFIFNDINSQNMNIVVKEMPPITRAEQRINTIKLEGRSGSLHEIEDKFDSFNIQIKCILMPSANINAIKSWLKGSGNLILSTDTSIYYEAVVVNKIDFSKYLTYLREFPIELELQPIAYGNTEHSVSIVANSEETIEVEGTYKTYPILAITGNGTITCNGKSIITKNSSSVIYVDCKLMNAYNGVQNMNSNVEGLEDPIFLNPGNNIITTTGVSVNVQYRGAWL